MRRLEALLHLIREIVDQLVWWAFIFQREAPSSLTFNYDFDLDCGVGGQTHGPTVNVVRENTSQQGEDDDGADDGRQSPLVRIKSDLFIFIAINSDNDFAIPRLIENPGEFPCILRLNGFG